MDIKEEKNYFSSERKCRVCLQTGNDFESIFPEETICDIISFAEQINQCSNIPWITRNDGFPQYICGVCEEMLEVAIRFRDICRISDEDIRSMDYQINGQETMKAEYLEEEEGLSLNSDSVDSSFNVKVEQPDPQKLSRPKRIIYVPTGDPPTFQCEECGKICPAARNLQRHMKIHLPEKPFTCPQCNRSFRTGKCLQMHLKTHSDERPYVCDVCGKSSKTPSVAIAHRKNHVNAGKFQCAHCPYRGSSKEYMAKHQRLHTGDMPYECIECKMKFAWRTNMIKHMRAVHEKRKDYTCDLCGKSFAERQAVRHHMVIHTGQKPFSCQLCPSVFGYLRGLQRHMKFIHPGYEAPKEQFFLQQKGLSK